MSRLGVASVVGFLSVIGPVGVAWGCGDPSLNKTVIGWSADSRFVVWTHGEDDPDGKVGHRFIVATVLDAVRGKTMDYVYDQGGALPPKKQTQARTLPGRSAFDRRFGPLRSGRHRGLLRFLGRGAPDGSRHAVVSFSPLPPYRKGKWHGDSFGALLAAQFLKPSRPPFDGVVRLAVSKSRRVWPSASFRPHVVDDVGALDITPYWSPDGLRVAWHLKAHSVLGGNQHTGDRIRVGPAGVPMIEVRRDSALNDAAVERTLSALARAALPASRLGRLHTPRKVSEVFAARGHEDLARAVARAIPGGAVVKPLSWRSRYDLVVALGASAR